MREFMNITKALADETRVRILMALRPGELCVCQITEFLGLSPSTVSKHLSILHQAGLVASRKAERWVWYHLPGKDATPVARATGRWLTQALAGEERILKDSQKLTTIRKSDLSEICKRQCPK